MAEALPSEPCAPLGAAAARPALRAVDLIRHWLGPLKARAILDVGCGGGGLARLLADEGARVTGVDPQEEAVERARAAVPEGHFEVAGAEALPFAEASFDAAIFSNSLHHVPMALMGAALEEAARVSRGPVLVIEPLAEGSFFETMRPVEDETEVRAAAQAALAEAMGAGRLALLRAGEYDDERRFKDVDGLLARLEAVDPGRSEAIGRTRDEVARRMARWGVAEGELIRFALPHRAHLLARQAD